MSELKATPGPWVVGESAFGDFPYCVDTGYGCEPTGMPNEIAPICSDRHDDEWGSEAEANAHLIAQSPTMYDFIRRLIDDSQLDIGWREEAEELLAKARGES